MEFSQTAVESSDSLEFVVESRQDDDRLDVRVIVRNLTSAEIAVALGDPCPLAIQVYADAEHNFRVWSESEWLAEQGVDCPRTLRERVVNGHASILFSHTVPLSSVRPRSGLHYATVLVATNDGALELAAGTVELND